MAETTCTVLVVDDEEDLRELVREGLESYGFTVRTAEDGRAALACLDGGLRPQLVLLDLFMPGMNGWELFDALRASSAHAGVPVVVVTSAPDRAPAGAQAVLKKPFDLDDLVATVRRHASRA